MATPACMRTSLPFPPAPPENRDGPESGGQILQPGKRTVRQWDNPIPGQTWRRACGPGLYMFSYPFLSGELNGSGSARFDRVGTRFRCVVRARPPGTRSPEGKTPCWRGRVPNSSGGRSPGTRPRIKRLPCSDLGGSVGRRSGGFRLSSGQDAAGVGDAIGRVEGLQLGRNQERTGVVLFGMSKDLPGAPLLRRAAPCTGPPRGGRGGGPDGGHGQRRHS